MNDGKFFKAAWLVLPAAVAGCGGGGGGGIGGGGVPQTVYGPLPANQIVFSESQGATREIYTMQNGVRAFYAEVPVTVESFTVQNAPSKNAVFARQSAAGQPYGIYIGTDAASASARTLVAPTYDYVGKIAVSHDGKYAVYVASQGGDPALYRVPLAGGGTVQLAAEADSLALAPADDRIAYGSNGHIFVMPLAGGTPQQITTGTGDDWRPAWRPDGQEIAFSSDRGGDGYDLYAVTLAGGQVRQLTNTPDVDEYGGAYDPTGVDIATVGVSVADGSTAIYEVNATTAATPTVLRTDPAVDYDLIWTPA